MANFTIIVRGVGLTYDKGDDTWRILLPFEECHDVKYFTVDNSSGIPVVSPITKLAGEDRTIDVSAVNATSTHEESNDTTEFVDLTASYSHAAGLNKKLDWNKRAVLMKIPNAKLSVDVMTQNRYEVVDAAGTTTQPDKQWAYSAKFEIRADSISIDATGMSDFPMTYSNDTLVIIDNDCEIGNASAVSDMDLMYNLLEDSNNPADRFEVRIPVATGSVGSGVGGSPGRGSIPCHMCKASDSSNLPN